MSHKIFAIFQGWQTALRVSTVFAVLDGRRFEYAIKGDQISLDVIDGTGEKPEVTKKYQFDLARGTTDASNSELDDFARFLI